MRALRRVAKTALSVFIAAALFVELVSAQNADTKWTSRVKFSASDKREIIALAKLVGVENPATVDANLRDDCCRIVSVTGRIVENGPERKWTTALMTRDSWREYSAEQPPKNRLRVGRWVADESPTQQWAEWRIRDGSWFVDVARGDNRPSIPYRDAELIVLALHNGKVVNKIPEIIYDGARSQPSIPTLKEGGPYSLLEFPERGASQYAIFIGDTMLRMRIVGDSVEAVSISSVEF
jgi:hypothetical protein